MVRRLNELPGVFGVGATCAICHLTTIDLGDYDLTGRTEGEKWDQLAPELARRKWLVRVKDNGAREVVCPVCQVELKNRLERPLPAFVTDPKCSKCGKTQINQLFCSGHDPQCGFGVVRDHMHHICTNCKFSWITGTADQMPGFWRRLRNWFGRKKAKHDDQGTRTADH